MRSQADQYPEFLHPAWEKRLSHVHFTTYGREKVNRRRQIDPTTCERDYTDAEIEFMHALDQYKRASGRMFPTCSEILEVVRGLGYVRISPTAAKPESTTELSSDSQATSICSGLPLPSVTH